MSADSDSDLSATTESRSYGGASAAASAASEYGRRTAAARLLDALALSSLCDVCTTREIWSSAPNAAREIARRRVAAGDDVSEAFCVAAGAANIDALVWLTRHGPNVNHRLQAAGSNELGVSSPRALTPLMIAAQLLDEGDAIRTVDTLLSLGADVCAVDTYSLDTALHITAHVSVVSRLLDAGARPDALNEAGLSPIGAAWGSARGPVLQEYRRRYSALAHRSLRASLELHDFRRVRELLDAREKIELKDYGSRRLLATFLAHVIFECDAALLTRLLDADAAHGGEHARGGGGLVNARVWMPGPGAFMPLLHIAAFAGGSGAGSFLEADPPPELEEGGGEGEEGGGATPAVDPAPPAEVGGDAPVSSSYYPDEPPTEGDSSLLLAYEGASFRTPLKHSAAAAAAAESGGRRSSQKPSPLSGGNGRGGLPSPSAGSGRGTSSRHRDLLAALAAVEEEDTRFAAHKAYRSIVTSLLAAGARPDAVISWKLPKDDPAPRSSSSSSTAPVSLAAICPGGVLPNCSALHMAV